MKCSLIINIFKYLFIISVLIVLVNNVQSEELGENKISKKEDVSIYQNDFRSKILSRKKRYLLFPVGSNFIATLSGVKSLIFKYPMPWNYVLECDVFYKLPNEPRIFRRKYHRKQPPAMMPTMPTMPTMPPMAPVWQQMHSWPPTQSWPPPPAWAPLVSMPPVPSHARRDRRDLYKTIEQVLYSKGINGQACVLRTICEVKQILAPKGFSLVHDLFRTIFTMALIEDENDILGPHDPYISASRGRTNSCDDETMNGCPVSILEFFLSYDNERTL